MNKILQILIVSLFCSTSSAKNIYVVEADTGNGTAWTNAFGSLQDALQASSAGDVIHVAAGVYYPYYGNQRGIFFELKNGVAVYGGWSKPGTYPSGTDPKRDIKKNISVLSGDVQQDGIDTNNSYHVVRAYMLDSTSILDGFTITEGFATGTNMYYPSCGGGILVVSGNPTLKNLILKNNGASSGGGIAIIAARGSFKHIAVVDNWASTGGGIAIGESMDFKFSGNIIFDSIYVANNSAAHLGGGINGRDAWFEVYNSTVTDNHGKSYGGGICIDGGGLKLINSTVMRNGSGKGGGIFQSGYYSSIFQNVLLADNYAAQGGGMLLWSRDGVYSGVSFSGNRATEKGDAFHCIYCKNIKFQNSIFDSIPSSKYTYSFEPTASPLSFFNCLFQGNMAGGIDSGGNIININPMYNNPTTGDYRLKSGSPAINAGNNNYIVPGTLSDLDNKMARIAYGIVDMGAYEYGSVFLANIITTKRHASLVVYPNPANEFVTIEASLNSTISLVNVNGQTIKKAMAESQKILLDISDLNPGIYFLTVRTVAGEVSSQPIVINK